MAHPLTIDELQRTINAEVQYPTGVLAAKALGIKVNAFRNRIVDARARGIVPNGTTINPSEDLLRRQNSRLEAEIKSYVRRLAEHDDTLHLLKQVIHDCDAPPRPPKWLSGKTTGKNTGVPTLFLSDIHFDEVVKADQINHVNAYDREIANARLKMLFTKTVDLLIHHMSKPQYDYFVLNLGGDCLSGLIHEELRETNEAPISQSILALLDQLIAGINFLLPFFPKIVVNAVVGNHGRWDRKPRMKNRVYENYEWLLYQILAKHYRDHKDIVFNIADGADCPYSIYSTRFVLTHGDQFKGGSGIAGALSPLMLGDARKRKRAIAIDQPFDYLCFTAGTQILCADGLRAIETVKVGDLVLTHTGRWMPVEKTMIRLASETVTVKGLGHFGITTTPEHPFYTYPVQYTNDRTINREIGEPEWAEAKNMGDRWWVSPSAFPESKCPEIDTTGCHELKVEMSDALLRVVGRWVGDGSLATCSSPRNRAGVPVAHWVRSTAFSIAGHEDEAQTIVDELRAAGIDTCSVQHSATTKGIAVSFARKALGRWVMQHFGTGAETKRFPAWLLGLPESSRRAFLEGYLSADGHWPESHRWELKTVNRSLAFGIKLLAQTLGQHTTISRRNGASGGFGKPNADGTHGLPQYVVKGNVETKRWVSSIFHREGLLGRVKKLIPGGPAQVYNIEVAGDHSYVADGLIVHNCMGHWHTLWMAKGIIVNGSVKGMDEYSFQSNFDFEVPQQWMYVTHPEWGITARWPILLEKPGTRF